MRSVWGQLKTQIGSDSDCENKLRSFLDQSWKKEITTLKPDIHTSPQNIYSTKMYSSELSTEAVWLTNLFYTTRVEQKYTLGDTEEPTK